MENPFNFLEPQANDDLQLGVPELPAELQTLEPPEQPVDEHETEDDLLEQEEDLLDHEEGLHERRVIFISHRQIAGLDQSMADLIEEELLTEELASEYEVYLDTAAAGGRQWRINLQNAMDRADFVIALITENANRIDADWMAFELAAAHRRLQRFGKPTIIPVHLEAIDEYKFHIGAPLEGAQRVDYTGDNAKLIAELRRAITGNGERPSNTDRLERFVVGEWRTKIFQAGLLDGKLDEINASLAEEKLVWITGDASVRNHLALSLAIKQQIDAAAQALPRRVYEIPKSQRWSKVHNTLISDSIIIFNDVVPGFLFEEEAQSNELSRLESLVERNNIVIITASADSYLEIEQEMRKRAFKRRLNFKVTHQFFNRDDKLIIFDKLLDFALETLEIDAQQHAWAKTNQVRQILNSIIENWSPADIERFITWHLRQAKNVGEILKLLQRNANLDNEIHSWFVSLDDSTRCFVLVLALFSDLRQEELWVKYKEVIEKLRKLDANLALWPLGICRERAGLYVTTEGPVDFTEERIADAVYREIAKNYREYFIEILPLMETWSVPEGRNGNRAEAISEVRRRQAVETEDVRAATAHMVGKVGQFGLADLTKLVDRWATDPIMQVREAVALSLEQAASQGFGTKQVFNILDSWTRDHTTSNDALRRAWSAASALGTIAASNPDKPIAKEALRRLEKLARDSRTSIRFYVSIPLKRAARKVALTDELENLLALVVQDDSASTKINVAEALNEARIFAAEAALTVIDRWLFSNDKNQRWAAVCSLIIWNVWHQRTDDTYQEIIRLVHHDAEIVASVFVEIVNHKRHKKGAPSLFRQVVLRAPDDIRKELIAGLAKIPFALLDERLLVRLRTATQTALQSLAADVRTQRWHELMEAPNQLVADLLDELENEQMSRELYLALTPLLEPEPAGSRGKLVGALADAFDENRAGLDQVLKKMKRIAPSTFEPLVAEVRAGAFERLFHDPVRFVDTVTAYLSFAQTAEETAEGLDLLAQHWPLGAHEELLQALAAAYALDPASITALLKLFRTSSTTRLRFVPYEFNLRLVEGFLIDPEALLAYITSARRDPEEFEEFVYILTQLAASEPEGKRKMLIAALAQARTTNALAVDELLQHPLIMAQPSLAGLKLEIRLATTLQNVFMPKILRKLFTPLR